MAVSMLEMMSDGGRLLSDPCGYRLGVRQEAGEPVNGALIYLIDLSRLSAAAARSSWRLPAAAATWGVLGVSCARRCARPLSRQVRPREAGKRKGITAYRGALDRA